MRVKLLLTCLCDVFFGEVGIAAAKVLAHAGCEVEFPEAQTCCGQPPFNAGAWEHAKPIATRCADLFGGEAPVVVPSSSCAAMLREGYPMLGVASPPTFELAEFLIRELGVDRWPLRGSICFRKRKVAFHRACHGRTLGLGDVQERLLSLVPGIEIVPIQEADQCCGFGGAFSATHPHVSAEIGTAKLWRVLEAGVDTLVSGDMGCLMHLDGLARKQGAPLVTLHYAQLLAEAIA